MEAAAPLVWIDLEMSGLDPDTCEILEIATIVTDGELEIIDEGPNIIIHQPEHVLLAMDAWCTRQHGDSGLTAAVRSSTVSLAQAEARSLDFIRSYCGPGRSPLCGNTIGHDRRFLLRYMPQLAGYLHYRNVDVSSIKELARRWYPDLPNLEKPETHRALDDIRASIAELRHYRKHIFRPSGITFS